MTLTLPATLLERFGVNFENNEIIFCEHEPGNECYFIQEGKVKVIKTVGNTQKTLDVLEAGDFFGEMAILEEELRSASAIAIEKVKALKFTRQNFDLLMQSQPQLAYQLSLIFSRRIFDAKRRLQILLLEDPQLKVTDVFLMLSEKDPRYGRLSEMVFNITMEDVASWSGLPITDTQRIINHFVRQGKIEIFTDRMIIKNINDFSRLVSAKRKNMM